LWALEGPESVLVKCQFYGSLARAVERCILRSNVTRFAALLLALLLVLPRAALGAVMLNCGQAAEREKCCCCQKDKEPPREPRLERSPCCKAEAPTQAPSTPAAPTTKPSLPALALAVPLFTTEARVAPELAIDAQVKLARGPPPLRKIPIFLSYCTLLY
jgi:hypothetical protein